MVKSDAHMERIRQRLLDESASIKKSEDKRKEREGKKFGKQVQIEKLKERERSKKDMEDRLKGLKRSTFFQTIFPGERSSCKPLQNERMHWTKATRTLTLLSKMPFLIDLQNALAVAHHLVGSVACPAMLVTANLVMVVLENGQNKTPGTLRMTSMHVAVAVGGEGVALGVALGVVEVVEVADVEVLSRTG